MALRDVTLDDKYDLGKSRIFVTGFQALVRLCLMQKELDRRSGLNTAGYVTGYRGAPLGSSNSPTFASRPASTRTWPPRRYGARSRRNCAAKASTMACSDSGMAK